MTADGAGPRNDAVCRQILHTKDHYAVLGLSRQSDESEVKAAYRRKAREVHPDKNASPQASEAFRRLQKAQEVLTDPKSRRRYDLFGDDEPPVQQHFRRPAYHHPSYGGSGGPVLSPFAALLPMVLAMVFAMVLFSLGGIVFSENMQHPYQQRQRQWQKQKQKKPEPTVTLLTRSNADLTCGVPGHKLCVTLLIDQTHSIGERETKLVEKMKNESESEVRNSRGQSVSWTWTVTGATARWRALLPSKATLPWVVVLKATRAGLRVAAMPVPEAGGRGKGRLTAGVPRLLQEIVVGSGKFEPIKGNVSSLFGL